jgi:hypothetical protein
VGTASQPVPGTGSLLGTPADAPVLITGGMKKLETLPFRSTRRTAVPPQSATSTRPLPLLSLIKQKRLNTESIGLLSGPNWICPSGLFLNSLASALASQVGALPGLASRTGAKKSSGATEDVATDAGAAREARDPSDRYRSISGSAGKVCCCHSSREASSG